ncbi:MAG: sulfatase [Verrucomicrobiota bacterium]
MKLVNFSLIVLVAITSQVAVSTELEKPNVLLLMVDDLNTWMLKKPGGYPGEVVAPNIKQLAASGVQFTRAYAASPKCSPSRTALLTGVAPWRSGHTDNGLIIKDNPLLAEAVSFPKLFEEAGYYMATSGKISHGYSDGVSWEKVWRHKRDPAPPGAPLNGFATAKSGKLTERDWGTTHLAESEMNDTLVADSAIEALKMEHDRPFFIACGLFHPHMPWYVPQKYFDLYPLDEIEIPPIKEDDLDDIPEPGLKLISGTYAEALQHDQYRKGVQAYLATTSYADAQIGRVLEALAKGPYSDNTIVVLMSDHGFHVGEKHHWQKGTLWEEATNSLLMFRVPGITKPNQVCERPVSLMDIYPTLTELAGLGLPAAVDGNSLVGLLSDVEAEHNHPVLSAYQEHVSVRTENYRLIRYGDGSIELYDRRKDPHEWINLSGNPECTSVREDLIKLLPDFEVPEYVRGKK